MPEENSAKGAAPAGGLGSAPGGKIEDIFDKVEKTSSSTVAQVEGQSIETKKVEPKFKNKVNVSRVIRLIIITIIIIILVFALWFVFSKIKGKSSEEGKVETPVEQAGQEESAEVPADFEDSEEGETLDSDHDGLTDAEERELGTQINSLDSDQDGLFDKEEVKIYLTDPLNPDTDNDGILDGEEVRKGSDPKDPNPNAKLLDLQKEIQKIK